MTAHDTAKAAATEKARAADALELANMLRTYAADIEAEGRTYVPAIMREAARRLERKGKAT